MKFLERFSLGTANFLSTYGLSNSHVNLDELNRILEYCSKVGIKNIDTASRYGDIEQYLLVNSSMDYFVSTKIEYQNEEKFINEIKRLSNFPISYLYLHNFDYFIAEKPVNRTAILRQNLEKFQMKVLLGASIYTSEEFQAAIDLNLDVIQFPNNILDGRFRALKDQAREQNIKLIGRSIFLQGILLRDHPHRLLNYSILRKYSEDILKIQEETGKSRLELLLIKAIADDSVDEVIFGVSSLGQLIKLIDIVNANKKVDFKIVEKLNDLAIFDEQVLNPRNWNV